MENESRCRACGQELTSVVSILRGIGPVCLRREQLEAGKAKKIRVRKGKGKVWQQWGLFDQVEVES